jgi:hypothetical protein
MAPPEILIAPELAAEPLPTHYLRRAQAYGFVRSVLADAFGPDGLAAIHREMPNGVAAPTSLADDLAAMQALCFGAYAHTCRQVGLPPTADPALGSGRGVEADIATFTAWTAALASDPDLGGDSRTMVPVYDDRQRQKTRVWVVLGWASRPLHLAYDTPPAVLDITRDGQKVDPSAVRLMFEDTHRALAYPVTAEVDVTRILNRDEFRALCDRHKSASAILKALR